jgi:hypothetical protein
MHCVSPSPALLRRPIPKASRRPIPSAPPPPSPATPARPLPPECEPPPAIPARPARPPPDPCLARVATTGHRSLSRLRPPCARFDHGMRRRGSPMHSSFDPDPDSTLEVGNFSPASTTRPSSIDRPAGDKEPEQQLTGCLPQAHSPHARQYPHHRSSWHALGNHLIIARRSVLGGGGWG